MQRNLVVAVAACAFVLVAQLYMTPYGTVPASNSPLTPAAVDRPRVALCFFGLVKVVDEDLVRALSEGLLRPLTDAGYVIDSFLHTYQATSFANAFNQETNDSVFNQTQSLGLLRGLLPDLRVKMDVTSTADSLLPMSVYIQAGDPWPFNANESLLYYLRQQYSLLRVTEMWSGADLTAILQSRSDSVELPIPVDRYDAVVYLRPDLYFTSKLSIMAFDAVIGASSIARRRVKSLDASTIATTLQHPWLRHDANQSDTNPMTRNSVLHIAIPTFQWGGLHDRFAFGGPEVMFHYGARALALRHYVGTLRMPPHAEVYLRRYLCALDAVVHLVPQFSARKRVNGRLFDHRAPQWRSEFYNKRTSIWSGWQQRGTIDMYGRGTMRPCLPVSMWGYTPLDPTAKRTTNYYRSVK